MSLNAYRIFKYFLTCQLAQYFIQTTPIWLRHSLKLLEMKDPPGSVSFFNCQLAEKLRDILYFFCAPRVGGIYIDKKMNFEGAHLIQHDAGE